MEIKCRLETPVSETSALVANNLQNLLITGAKILAHNGHEDVNQGQISVRAPGNKETFFIKKALCPFYKTDANNILTVPYDHNLPADRLSPPELPLHQAIYQRREDVNAIVHTHAYYSSLFSVFDWEIEPITHDGACFVGHVNKFTETSNTILNISLANRVAASLGDAKVLLLQNHGVVITGKSIKEAVVLAIFFEKACKVQLHARMCNAPYSVSNTTDVIEKQRFIFSKPSINYFWMCMEEAIHDEFSRIIGTAKY